MIPLPIKSVFSTAGIGIQSVSSPACGMEWCFNLDLLATSGGKKVEKCAKKSVGTPEGDDINTVRMGASFLSIPAGFQPGTILVWGLFRRGDCAIDDESHQGLARQQFSC